MNIACPVCCLDIRELRETSRDVLASEFPSFIFVRNDDDVTVPVGVFPNGFLLRQRHCAAHEGNRFAATELMQLHRAEESFDNVPVIERVP